MSDYALLGLIISFIGVAVAAGVAIFRFGRWTYKTDVRLDRVEGGLGALLMIHRKELVNFYLEETPSSSNPHPTEKDLLLIKLSQGTITYQESQRLQQLLQQEQAEATGKSLVAIAGLLLLLWFINEALKPKRR